MNPSARPEFLARYWVESFEPLAKVAEIIAGEQSSGTFLQLAGETAAARPRRILISGGDTSSGIARALDIQAVEVAARLAPGEPLCRVLESSCVPGVEVAFKGGQMGSRTFFDEARRG